jgi:CheY-like chemotaxis protein
MNVVHILLAEDNFGEVLLVQRALEENRIAHELHVARDGVEALAFVAQIGERGGMPCPDVILLDLNLPKIDGPNVLSEFRKHPACAHTPVIVVSSSDAPKDRALMAKLGVDRYFKKPSDLDAFMQLAPVVREVIEGRGRVNGRVLR